MGLFKVLFFARCKEIVGAPSEQFEVSPLNVSSSVTVRDLVSAVVSKYPSMSSILETLVLSVNLNYTSRDSDLALKETDEIAFIPPLSGG